MIIATSLVMLMTPGLAFFYGGLGSKKHILSIMMQSFVSMGISSILWFFIVFSTILLYMFSRAIPPTLFAI